MQIAQGQWVELELTGRVVDTGEIFVTTAEEDAKAAGLEPALGIYNIGSGQLFPALEAQLLGKEIGSSGKTELKPDQAYGPKRPQLINLISAKKFLDNGIVPEPGLVVALDGLQGRILTVTGGRVLVDFNHPLAGKTICYEWKIKRIVTDKSEQLRALLKLHGLEAEFEIKDSKAMIKAKAELQQELKKAFEVRAKELVGLEVEFESQQKSEKEH